MGFDQHKEIARNELAKKLNVRAGIVPETAVTEEALRLAEAELSLAEAELEKFRKAERGLIEQTDRVLKRLAEAKEKCFVEEARANAWKAACYAWRSVTLVGSRPQAEALEKVAEEKDQQAIRSHSRNAEGRAPHGELRPAHGGRGE